MMEAITGLLETIMGLLGDINLEELLATITGLFGGLLG